MGKIPAEKSTDLPSWGMESRFLGYRGPNSCEGQAEFMVVEDQKSKRVTPGPFQ